MPAGPTATSGSSGHCIWRRAQHRLDHASVTSTSSSTFTSTRRATDTLTQPLPASSARRCHSASSAAVNGGTRRPTRLRSSAVVVIDVGRSRSFAAFKKGTSLDIKCLGNKAANIGNVLIP